MSDDRTSSLRSLYDKLGLADRDVGVMVVDHGSRREESNRALLQVVDMFRHQTPFRLVEPAHMELAEPSIATAFDRLVERGAKLVAVHPYFLLPGRHWAEDIPALVAAAARMHPGVRHLVTSPLGVHPLMSQVMNDRIEHCLRHLAEEAGTCDLCDADRGRCRGPDG